MTSKDVIQVIDAICEKIGAGIHSFNDFVPALAKKQIVGSAYWVILSLIVITSLLIAVWIASRSAEKEIVGSPYLDSVFDCGWFSVMAIVSAAIILIFAIILIVALGDLISWVASPEANAITYILRIISQDM